MEKSKNDSYFIVFIIVFIVLVAYIRAIFKERKIQELEALKKTIERNKKLDDALQKKRRKYFIFARFLAMILYFVLYSFLYYHISGCSFFQRIENLLNVNTIIFIFVSWLTFARFGSFKSIHEWWSCIETKITICIYRNSPDIQKIIENDSEYKKQLEDEIRSL